MDNKGDQSFLVSETSESDLNYDQSMVVSEGDQSDLISANQSMQLSEGDQSDLISGNQSMQFSDDQSILISEGDQSILISEDNQSYLSNLMSEVSLDEDNYEDILECEEDTANMHYPNEAYADLMTLITKYKLSNAAGNAMIKFFNKHANLISSPLPKSIEEGRKFMDNMNLPNLTFDKTHVITYNDNNYYLHHRSLIKCIKNILSIPGLSRDFTLNFENFEVRNFDNASLCCYIMYIYLALL